MQARVLDGIDLAVPRRARLVVLGHHGSGKSTLLRVIAATQLASERQVERRGTAPRPAWHASRSPTGLCACSCCGWPKSTW
ncbi:ATP-binding cassette domain-containing protein [Reyranella sp.]|uniref:ATP-binding cassette domain-containing protein n=1 Tax=Reyranella sp. TaxID=1929291 RepID=UPI003F72EBC2